jgi:hypothetical protein
VSQIGFTACAKATVSKCALLILPLVLYGCSTPAPNTDLKDPPRKIEFARGPGPYNFDCNGTSDHNDQLNIRSPNGGWQVTGFFRILTNRGVEHTYPRADITLIASKGSASLIAEVTNSDTTWFVYGDPGFLRTFAKEAFSYARIPFVLKIDRVGKVSGSIDGNEVPGDRDVLGFGYLRLTCSNAHVRFSDVTLVPLT